jgi:hypothetical protein
MVVDVDKILTKFKEGKNSGYNEDFHCRLLIQVMCDKDRGTVSAFCMEAAIGERTFHQWVNTHDIFSDLYAFCRMYAREEWEKEGRLIKDRELPIGMIDHAFDYWKLIGWSRYGISKNSRIRLNLDANATPDKHYAQLLRQASDGDFTAGEIKQLMEAINVGLNTHQVFNMQKEIDQLKSDLATMAANNDGHNSSTNKGIA